VLQVLQDLMAMMVQLDHRALQDLKEQLDRKDLQVIQGLQVAKVLLVLKEQLVLVVTPLEAVLLQAM
jgi:hypothetical protein